VTDFVKHAPYSGWRRSLVDLASFDSRPEFVAARALDVSTDLTWWHRNDPPVFVIETPVGDFEVDFLYERTVSGQKTRGLLEIKGDFLWSGPSSPDQIKANAACRWVAAQNQVDGGIHWEFALVLESDVPATPHIEQLISNARMREPA
jgi:type III restriction enzyme